MLLKKLSIIFLMLFIESAISFGFTQASLGNPYDFHRVIKSAEGILSDHFKIGLRWTLGKVESDFMGKVHGAFNFDEEANSILRILDKHRCSPWVERGRVELPYGLYREYSGSGIRFIVKPNCGVGIYYYNDTIGQERELQRNYSMGDLVFRVCSWDDNKDNLLIPLIPKGKSRNMGIEGFTPYVNWSINYYRFGSINKERGFTKGSTLHTINNLINPINRSRDDLLQEHPFATHTKIHKAVDLHAWHNFSRCSVLTGLFYQWMDGPYKKYKSEPPMQCLDVYGGCIELRIFIHPIILRIRNTWDNHNGNRISCTLQLETLSAQHILYQPVQRYMMPIQYDSTFMPDIYKDNYRSNMREEVRRQREKNRGLPECRIQVVE